MLRSIVMKPFGTMTGHGLALALVVAMSAQAALAQGAGMSFGADDQDTEAPVEVMADSLSVDQDAGTALYSGDVIVIQDDMRLSAPEVLVVYSEENDSIDKVIASGGVTLVSGEEAAEGNRAEYDIEAGIIVMTGDVLVTRGDSVMAAQRMDFDLDSGSAELSGRVRTVLDPNDEG